MSAYSSYGYLQKTNTIPRNKQHIAFVIGVGGLYPDPEVVRGVLAPEEGKNKKILDLGAPSSSFS